MNVLRIIVFFCGLALVSVAAEAQTNVRVRGTITAFDGQVLSVKSREGKDLALQMTEQTTVAAAKAITLVAVEVHTIPRTVPEGYAPWDLQPDTMMTNANVAAVVQAADGQELTLEYKGNSQKVLVPAGTSVITTVPGERSLLRPGEYVFLIAQTGTNDKMTALRIQVSKDGVKPAL